MKIVEADHAHRDRLADVGTRGSSGQLASFCTAEDAALVPIGCERSERREECAMVLVARPFGNGIDDQIVEALRSDSAVRHGSDDLRGSFADGDVPTASKCGSGQYAGERERAES